MGKASVADIVAAGAAVTASYGAFVDTEGRVKAWLAGKESITLAQARDLVLALNRAYEMLIVAANSGMLACTAFAVKADAALFPGEAENG